MMMSVALTTQQYERRLAERLGFGPHEPAAGLLGQAATASVDPGPRPAVDSPDAAVRAAAQEQLSRQNIAVQIWWLDLMASTTTPFVERMTWFWHGHFATSATAVENARSMARQNITLRAAGLGSFDALAQAMVVDPAMLVWLNGDLNRVGAPNENLGRELMELFTLGVGHYSEADVKEAARALTGWTVDQNAVSAQLDPARADPRPKTVLGAPVQAASDLVTMLVARPESARFVVGRVWERFVSAGPPPADAVERLVAAYGPQHDIRALMAAIAVEPAMADPASVLVKQPVEWAVGLMRAVGARPAALALAEQTYLLVLLAQLGQVPLMPPSVGGWPSGPAWLTTSAALARLSLAQLIVNRGSVPSVAGVAAGGRIAAAGALLGVETWSGRSVQALAAAGDDPAAIVAVAACAPEVVMSR